MDFENSLVAFKLVIGILTFLLVKRFIKSPLNSFAVADAKRRAKFTPEQKTQIAHADVLNSQIMEAYQTGNYTEGIHAASECLEIRKRLLGDQHPDYAASLNSLALLYDSQSDYPRAESLYREAMAIDEKVLGKQHPHYAIGLNNLARLYHLRGDYPRAEKLFREALAIQEQVLGKESPDYATSLHNLGELYRSLDDYARAELLYCEALAINEKLLGKQHRHYALNLSGLAELYRLLGNSSRAEPLYHEVLAIQEKVLGKEHPDYAQSMYSLALLYNSQGDYSRAEPLFVEAIAIEEKVLGVEHPDYAKSLVNLAGLYFSISDYPRAEPLYLEALAIQEKVLGNQHPDYTICLKNLAKLYRSLGDYLRAETLHLEALAIQEQVLGKEHPDYATSLHNLAELYRSLGDYARAEPLYLEALAIQEKVLGKEHPDYAFSLIGQAVSDKSLGDYPRAKSLLREAIAILEKALGKQHPDYAKSLINLAGLYHATGDYPRAEPLFREAMAILAKVLGKEHLHYATSMNNLAALYGSVGDYTRAELLYCEAVAIQEKVLGKEHPDYATSLHNLAELYGSLGDYPRAEPLFREALAIWGKVLGKEHPDYASGLHNLAFLYQSMGDYPRAVSLYCEAVDISLKSLELTADVQSQRQQMRMGESLRYRVDDYLSLAVGQPQFQPGAYGALLRWKGSVWQRQQRGRLLIDEPSLKPSFAALQKVSSELSTLILRVPEQNQLDAWRRQLDELADQREKLQRDLSLASVAFRQASTPVTLEQLRESLPDGTMLVDFLEFNYFTPGNKEQQTENTWERRLLVHLVRGDEELRVIDLGPVAAITDLVQAWRRDLGTSPAAVDAATQLRNRIWEPLAEHLSGITMVYVSPDGALGQFPLGALPGKEAGTYLLEELAIVMLPVPQALPAIMQSPDRSTDASDDRFFLLGGVDYERVTTSSEPIAPSTPTTPSNEPPPAAPLILAARGNEPNVYQPLPGTIAEIETIDSLLRVHRPAATTTILRGAQASEAAFSLAAPGHRYLHVATHGFFAPESVKNALNASTPEANRMLTSDDLRSPKLIGQHPDLLSGLVFAGANQAPEGVADDGILTAAEVQSLDLRGVELAVLSACETGLGATAGGEGIIGLQRAFQLAGAKTTITSLWQVDDAATQALMVEFYRNLFERKLGKLESLRQAQIMMLNRYEPQTGEFSRGLGTKSVQVAATAPQPTTVAPSTTPTRLPPRYWAAFQLSGDPR